MISHVFYLHGFASSAQSTKAAYFAERLRAHGVGLRCPDFNEPDFASLTMTRMIERVEREIALLPAGPIALIGSSLGGVVAIHVAGALCDRIDLLVLLAPALMFGKDEHPFLGQERVARWRAAGTLDVFHYAHGATRPLGYGFYEDSLTYDVFDVVIRQPTLIFQGLRDESVDHADVEQYAAARPNVALTLLDDDHQLVASLPRIWDATARFLELTA